MPGLKILAWLKEKKNLKTDFRMSRNHQLVQK
jgi:hypothetical protein